IADAGSSPTRIVARAGLGLPSATRAATKAPTWSKISPASACPSSLRAVMRQLSREAPARRRNGLGRRLCARGRRRGGSRRCADDRVGRARDRRGRRKGRVDWCQVAQPGPPGDPEIQEKEQKQDDDAGPDPDRRGGVYALGPALLASGHAEPAAVVAGGQ